MNRAKWWKKESLVVDRMIRLGVKQYWAKLQPKYWEATDRVLRCIDEGTPGGIHLAGSGILLGLDEAERFARAANVTAISWHKYCGAAGIYTSRHGGDTDTNAREFANRLAACLGVKVLEVELQRPAELHIARVIYVDSTGKFDPSLVKGMPVGFVICARWQSQRRWLAELDMSIAIALGKHGFGRLFTSERPLVIVPVDLDDINLRRTADAIHRHLINSSDRWRIRIDGLSLEV